MSRTTPLVILNDLWSKVEAVLESKPTARRKDDQKPFAGLSTRIDAANTESTSKPGSYTASTGCDITAAPGQTISEPTPEPNTSLSPERQSLSTPQATIEDDAVPTPRANRSSSPALRSTSASQTAGGMNAEPAAKSAVSSNPAPQATAPSPSPSGQMQATASEDVTSWTVDLSPTQTQVYKYRHDEGVYCAYPCEIPIPTSILQRFTDGGQQDEIHTNLEPFRHRASKRFKPADAVIEMPELRLSGRCAGTRVSLLPTVWILCRTFALRNKLRRWVRDAPWFKRVEYPFEIQYGTSVWAGKTEDDLTSTGKIDLAGHKAVVQLDSDTRLYAHLEKGARLGICGRRLCFTAIRDNEILWQRFSLAGGILNVDEILYLVTTAHCIVQEFYNTQPALQPPAEMDYGDNWDSASEDDSSPTQTEPDEDNEITQGNHQPGNGLATAETVSWNRAVDFINPFGLMRWANLAKRGPINFLGAGTTEADPESYRPDGGGPSTLGILPLEHWENCNGLATMSTSATTPTKVPGAQTPLSDFALLGVLSPSIFVTNDYNVWGKWHQISKVAKEEAMQAGEVYVVVDDFTPRWGFLLPPQKSQIQTRNASIETRKIQLNACLAVARNETGPGTSGAWVVQGEVLIGMVVAVYEGEPFAQIITAEKLLSDIRASLSPGTDVYLPLKRFEHGASTDDGRSSSSHGSASSSGYGSTSRSGTGSLGSRDGTGTSSRRNRAGMDVVVVSW
ncbi:hypothetical protein RB600_000374 [Gaeumannomyces tritici]